MNKDILQGNWNIIKGKIKEKWANLSDNDLAEINGKREQLVGKLQKKYGIAKERAEREIAEWERTFETKETHKAGTTTGYQPRENNRSKKH
jgi:uncharacterized protein YjbJ (UPF0337 family)